MSRVATACDISKANIYHYYDSKNALLFGMLDTHLGNLRDRVCAIELAHLEPEERFHATVSAIRLAYQVAEDEHRVQADHVTGMIRANAPRTFAADPGRGYVGVWNAELVLHVEHQGWEQSARRLCGAGCRPDADGD